jgi:ABC-type transport system involved in multi-copper enzyme maturation permease subunit
MSETGVTINSKENISFSRGIQQIGDTIAFEFQKNLKKIVYLVLIAVVLQTLGFVLIGATNGWVFVDNMTARGFAQNMVGQINLFIYISGCALSGSVFCADFEKDTKNLLFPMINRNRLFAGRIISVILMQIGVVFIYYIIDVALTGYLFREIPSELWKSMVWAMFFGITVTTFVAFFSSFMRSVTGTVVLSFLLLFMVFNIIYSLMSFTTVEPLMILTYYGNFITYSMNMPTGNRYIDQTVPIQDEITIKLRTWLTPSQTGFLWGNFIHILIFVVFAYFIFRVRREK